MRVKGDGMEEPMVQKPPKVRENRHVVTESAVILELHVTASSNAYETTGRALTGENLRGNPICRKTSKCCEVSG